MKDEKLHIAFSSLTWALVLTCTKLTVALITGSLGILSEALHSGLDLVAAGITVYAVRQSARPADHDHPFGHGKFENFSALMETLLLVATSIWIVYEAVVRLTDPGFVGPETSVWAFGVMIFAIVVDLGRSRALMRVARKTGSQALEADALHFSSDVWSSTAVIGGLGFAAMGFPKADPIAALCVAAVVLLVAWRLVRRSVDALLDKAPDGITDAIRDLVRGVSGVSGVQSIRVRSVGADLHVELVVRIDGSQSLQWAHAVADRVEAEVHGVHPSAHVSVHMEPEARPTGS